jgi:hypothetical protein
MSVQLTGTCETTFCSRQNPALTNEGRVHLVKSSGVKKTAFYGVYPFLADAAAVSAIASGVQHSTTRAIAIGYIRKRGRRVTGPARSRSAPCKSRQDMRGPTDCRRHETAEGNLRPMSGVEGPARERQRSEAGAHDQGAGFHAASDYCDVPLNVGR